MDPTQQEMLRNTISSPFERVHLRRIHTEHTIKQGKLYVK
jgi:hypothetical protein